jgi:hypothetical protein
LKDAREDETASIFRELKVGEKEMVPGSPHRGKRVTLGGDRRGLPFISKS